MSETKFHAAVIAVTLGITAVGIPRVSLATIVPLNVTVSTACDGSGINQRTGLTDTYSAVDAFVGSGPPEWASSSGNSDTFAALSLVDWRGAYGLQQLSLRCQIASTMPNGWTYSGYSSMAYGLQLDKKYSYTVTMLDSYAVTHSGSCIPSWCSAAGGVLRPGTYSDAASTSMQGSSVRDCKIQFTLLPPEQQPKTLYFGIGVDWTGTSGAGVRGNLDVDRMATALGQIPTLANPTKVELSATASGLKNRDQISAQFTSFSGTVNPDDTVVLHVSSHGEQTGPFSAKVGVSQDGTGLDPWYISSLLDQLPKDARKIVIIDACHADIIGSGLTILGANNLVVLAPVDGLGLSHAMADGAGMGSNMIEAELNKGVTSLQQMISDIPGLAKNTYGDNVELTLKDSGTGVFTGLHLVTYQSTDFSGDFIGPYVGVPEPTFLSMLCLSAVGLLRRRHAA